MSLSLLERSLAHAVHPIFLYLSTPSFLCSCVKNIFRQIVILTVLKLMELLSKYEFFDRFQVEHSYLFCNLLRRRD